MKGRFAMAYAGPISYYAALIRCSEVWLDPTETWLKQSYRNRTYIDAPNGKLMLNIPIDHQRSAGSAGSMYLSDAEAWRAKHWQAFKTTYNLSPFFDELGPDLEELLFSPQQNLFDFNLRLLRIVLGWLRADVIVHTEIKDESQWNDMRGAFHPKKGEVPSVPPYPQVFAHKHGFLTELSILDLCFNEGPAAYDYLNTL